MTVKIEFPELIPVPMELPLYAVMAPGWTAEKAAEMARRFDLKGDCVDAGAWYVTRNDLWTLEVYQASHSLRLERNDYDAEGRKDRRNLNADAPYRHEQADRDNDDAHDIAHQS